MSERIAAVHATTVELPLPFTLEIAGFRIDSRQYAVVEVETESGHRGVALSLTRSLPLTAAVNDGIAPHVIDLEARADEAIWQEAHAAIGRRSAEPAWRRALSLVDVALWDATARSLGVPLWRALGGTSAWPVPVMVVGGYPRPDESPEQEGERLARYLQAGYPLVKVARQGDGSTMARILSSAAESGAPMDRIVADAAWAWDTPAAAVRELHEWNVHTLAWLEDPLAAPTPEALATLRRDARLPVGSGDEETNPDRLAALVESRAVDVLRLDVTTIGGFTAAAPLLALAAREGIPVSTHVYPHLHVHAALAFPACRWVETFDPLDNPFDPADLLFVGGVRLGPGTATAAEAPGLGVELDGELVERHRVGT